MRIAFVGDSFCEHTGPGTPIEDYVDENELAIKLLKKHNMEKDFETTMKAVPDDFDHYDWPDLVVKHFGADITECGIGGINFYHSYQKFMREQETDHCDVVIFCVTEPLRTINKYELPINYPKLKSMLSDDPQGKWMLDYFVEAKHHKRKHGGKSKEDILVMLKNMEYMYENVQDDIANITLHKTFINFVDQTMLEKKQNCIWFNSFSEYEVPWMDDFNPRSGPMGDYSLYHIAKVNFSDGNMGDIKDFHYRNHFTKEQNITMAKMIIDVIENKHFAPGKLPMETWFEIDGPEKDEHNEFIYP